MAQRRHVGAGDIVETGLGPVIGVGTPRGVVQEAGRPHQPVAFGRQVREQRQQELVQLLAETRQAGHLLFGEPRRLDQRVTLAQRRGHVLVEQPLADAIAGDRQFLGAEDLYHLRQDLRGQRHQFDPRGGDADLGAQGAQIVLADPGDGVGHGVGGHAVFVQDGHGIAHAFHVQPRDGAPRSADQIDPVVIGAQLFDQPLQDRGDMRAQLIGRHLLQAERAQLRRHAPTDLAVRDLCQLHRVAADVADQPARIGPAQQDALRGQPGLLLAVDDVQFHARLLLDAALEGGAVLGLAHGGGCDAGQRRDVHAARKRREPGQGGKAALDAFRVQAAGAGHVLAQTRHDLFVVEIGGRPRRPVKDHQPDRVRTDIHHADPFQGPLGQLAECAAEWLDRLAACRAYAVHLAAPCLWSPV